MTIKRTLRIPNDLPKKKSPTVPKTAKTVAKKPPTVPKVAKATKAVAKKPPTVPKATKATKVTKTVAKKPLKDAKATKATKAVAKKPPTVPKAMKATKAVAKKPPTVPKAMKATKAVAKKPLKDAKATKVAKAVAKKPLKDAKATKATKAVAKKPLKDAKVAKAAKPSNATKAVVKKSKTQIYRGSGCSGFFCTSKVEDESTQQPLTQLEERINRMNVVKQYLEKNAYDNECVIERERGLYIKDLQLIIKDLGKYVDNKKNILTTNIDGNNVVIKLIERSDELEINIMVAIRDHIISKNISKHFLIIYFNSLCNDTTIPYPLIIYNESVENSLNHILYNLNDDDDTFHNLLIQSLLSIGSYHNLTGYVHMDTHTGNFLYAKNSEHNPEGYYQYRFGDETYYLKSCGYNVMIYDFGDSNKIDIPIDKIKRFELFYENDNYEVARSYIVKGGLYNIVKQNGSYILYEPDDDLNLTVREGKSYGTNEGNTFNYDDILYIYNMFVDIVNNANYYRIKILIDDYYIFLKRVSEIFVRGNRSALIGVIIDEIEKIKGDYDYLKTHSTITDAQLYGCAKDIFKRVLDICIRHFPKIFSKKETKSMLSTLFAKLQKPTPQHILNNPPYLLYQQTKITVEEPTITQ
jgi:hypothetical protein